MMNGLKMRISARSSLRTSCFALFAIVCLLQCYTIMKTFMRYPFVIDIYDSSPTLTQILPGITLCNNNRLSLRSVVKRNRELGEAIKGRFPRWYHDNQPHLGDGEFNTFRDELSKIYTRFKFDPQQVLDNSTLNEMFAQKPNTKPFLSWIGCTRTFTDSIDCASVSQVDSIQDRRCTTILHRGALTFDQARRPQVFNSSLITGRQSYFNDKDLVKFILDFEPEDYADLKRQIGGRLMLHDSKYIASATDLDFFVTRGYSYEFSVDREDNILLHKPYVGCYNYTAANIDGFLFEIDPRLPLHGSTCLQNCVLKNVIHKFKCWPPSMPYFRNDSLDPKLELKVCNWFDGARHVSNLNDVLKASHLTAGERHVEANTRMQAYTKIRRHCSSTCQPSCHLTHYTVSVTRAAWPTDIGIVFDTTGMDRVLRHCCALITVKYSNFHHNMHEFQPKYNLTDTIGNIGGLLAVWLGLSMVSVYHAIQKLIELMTRRSLSRRIHAQHLEDDQAVCSSSSLDLPISIASVVRSESEFGATTGT